MRTERATLIKNGIKENYIFYIFDQCETKSYKEIHQMNRPDFVAMRSQAFNEVLNSVPDSATMAEFKEIYALREQYITRLEFAWSSRGL